MKFTLPSSTLGRRIDIVVVGAGGTGSAVLANLAQLAVALPQLGHPGIDVHAMDDDTVSQANVGRQLFSPADIGLSKAAVLVNRINLTYGLEWRANHARFDADGMRQMRDRPMVVIGCVDSRAGRAAMHAWHERSDYNDDRYWLDCGNMAHSGQVVLGARSRLEVLLPSVGDLFPEVIDGAADAGDDAPSCSLAEALTKQDLLVNRFMADAAVNLLWRMLRHGGLDSHGAFVDIASMSMRPIPADPAFWARMGWEPSQKRARLLKAA